MFSCSPTVKGSFFPSVTLIYGISHDGSKNFNIRTCEHMILGQLRMGARQTLVIHNHLAARNCTWSRLILSIALGRFDPLHVGRVKKLSGLASGGHRRLQHLAIPTLQLFTSAL